MKKLILTLCISTIFLFSFGQSKIDRCEKKMDESTFLTSLKETYRLSEETTMELYRSHTAKNGITHKRYKQKFRGLPVIDASYIVHVKDGIVVSGNGELLSDIQTNINPSISIENAKKVALKYTKKTKRLETSLADSTAKNAQLCIFNQGTSKKPNPMLAYEVEVFDMGANPLRVFVYVDANSGILLDIREGALHLKSKGSGMTHYYGMVQFDHDSIAPNQYKLQDLSRGKGIIIKDYFKGLPQSSTPNYNDSENMRANIETLYASEFYFDFLKDKFDYNSLDNEGYQIVCNTNIFGLGNAFWDGNEVFFGGKECDGFNSFTSIDVVTHEITHGLTQFNSDLVYSGESGALNESLSDIFGKTIEYKLDPSGFTWILGKELDPVFHTASRSMSNPNESDCPKYYKGYLWDTEEEVHTNSGVLNYWYYLITEGGHDTNEKGYAFDFDGIGIDKAIDLVFDIATHYLTEKSDYKAIYTYSLESAKALFGDESAELHTIQEAWKTVGIGENITNNGLEDFLLTAYVENNNYFLLKCPDAFDAPLPLYVNNKGKTIPQGASIQMTVLATVYTNLEADQLFILLDTTMTLDHEVKTDESILNTFVQLQLKEMEYVDDAEFEYALNAIVDGNEYPFENSQFFFIFGSVNPSETFYQTSNVVIAGGDCADNFPYQKLGVNMDSDLCIFEDQEFQFELQITKDNMIEKYNFSEILSFFESRFSINLLDYIGQNDIGKNINAQLFYINDENEKFLIYKWQTKINQLSSLKKGTIVDFNNSQASEFLVVNDGTDNETSYFNKNLSINSFYRIWSDYSCHPIEDVFALYEENEGGISRIYICADLKDMVEPTLQFKAKFGSSQPYEGMAKVFQDGNLLPNGFILPTNIFDKNYQFPLDQAEKSNISMTIAITYESSFTLDDIKIFDKYVATQEFNDGNNFKVVNPSMNQLIVLTNEAQPYTFDLIDINGQRIISQKLSGSQSKMDISTLLPGTYLYRITSDQGIQVGKVVIVQ